MIMPPQHNFGLTDVELQRLIDVVRGFAHVEKAIIYGSRARGTNRRFYDIDLTLTGDRLTIDDLTRIDEAIDNLLLPYEVDLSLYASLTNEALLSDIARDGVDLLA